jgi:serine/threonine protein kinase
MNTDSRYRIIERIAAGGMAEVFKGVAESIQGFRKNVAIKRVLPALTKNKKFVAMFLDEARLSLHLQHANIVQVFDIGHTDETYFIVMEYVDGIDLKRLVEWRRRIGRLLTIGQTVYIIMEVAKGLAYAHEAAHPETGRPLGIVHRDVSPPNVLLSRNGEIKVTDFGLAKAAVQVETTDPGVVKGKMSYLSPEAARGEEVDRRADIFAVGILLYEMLTGKRLFYGETDYQTVELVRAARVPPIGAQNPEVEPELEEIVRKSLARRADDRFQSAADLQDALAHYIFSRGLKMIQRDIADMVRACFDDGIAGTGPARKPKPNIIDTLLQDEIQSFTSVEFDEKADTQAGPSPFAVQGMPSQLDHDFIDPRGWADDTDMHRRTGQGPVRRPTGDVRMLPDRLSQPPAPPPASSPPPVRQPSASVPAVSARTPISGRSAVNEPRFSPTPDPERLAEVLEPGGPVGGLRKLPRSVIIGVLVGALVIGAAFAAWLVKG